MKKLIFIAFFLVKGFVMAQITPVIYIDNAPIKIQSSISLPYWIGAGKVLQLGKDAVSASVLEFSVTGTELVFSQAINITNNGTVPTGKVWKIEAIGLGNNSTYSSTSNFSSSVVPSIFESPIVFSTAGTFNWSVPPGVTNICVEVWGGGGAGGEGGLNTSYNGGGGGGGGYSYKCINVIQGTNYVITVGAPAGSSSFGSLVISTGGQNGSSATSGSHGIGGIGGSGNGSFNYSGSNGAAGNSGSSGGSGGGNGGAGGIGGNSSGSTGQDGASPGGGGGGGKATGNALTNNGGAGSKGLVKIYF